MLGFSIKVGIIRILYNPKNLDFAGQGFLTCYSQLLKVRDSHRE